MDFARKQLEKYGWTDGKGLGKHENGISEALKPKMKRSVAGIGHDAAKDFTEHWWTTLYNKAASNVEVEEDNGRTKKIKTKDDQFKITNSSYHLNKKDTKNDEEYSDFFVKTIVLTNGGTTERVKESDTESEEEKEKKDVFKMTDEELFAACEGRTAHKGARHGLRALGKLARIEQQEQMLLALPQYEGYSHAKKLKKGFKNTEPVVEVANTSEDTECTQIKKKKKKRKRCSSLQSSSNVEGGCIEENKNGDFLAGNENGDVDTKKKSKKKSNDQEADTQFNEEIDEQDSVKTKKKKKRKHEEEMEQESMDFESEIINNDVIVTKKKKKKRKRDEERMED